MTIRKPESEHSPMSGWDEYPIHQIAAPLRIVGTSDARAYERYWFSAQDMDGEFAMMIGIGFYPNLGTVEAYVAFNHDHKHTTVRTHRHLNDTRNEISCGPFLFEVIEPFREWRIRLGENEHGMRFDLRWRDTKRAIFQQLGGGTETTGRMPTAQCGYESFGRIEGEVVLDGRTFKLVPEKTLGSRDHHWGVRDGVGGPGHADPGVRHSHLGQWVEFGDWSIWGRRCLLPLGASKRGALKIARVDAALKFDPQTHHFIGGTVTNHLANGKVKVVHYDQIDDKVLYLRTGMYMNLYNQGTPDQNYYQGIDLGDGVSSRDTYDLTDPITRAHLAGFEDHLVRATCDGETTVGLIEAMNPSLYEMAKAGLPGYKLA
ncbi:MAG: hypothetical protein QM769_07295 [Pseudoxanthomonas sp.]